jgi:hypothetical protein
MLRTAALCLLVPAGLLPSPASACRELGRAHYEPRSFLGYACEDECQRHKRGFHWAEQWAVTDARSCEPLGRLEAQGCRAYLDEWSDAEAAGGRWAIENEIADPRLCDGAGARFRAGCATAAEMPSASSP